MVFVTVILLYCYIASVIVINLIENVIKYMLPFLVLSDLTVFNTIWFLHVTQNKKSVLFSNEYFTV
jgi:hypothetical protein